jgi:hypothetical protein
MPAREGSATEMLQRLRIARFAQTALAAACLLAVTGSAGLHPEPGPAASDASIRSSAWERTQPPGAPSHGCLACLAHRSIPLASLLAFVQQIGACVAAVSPLTTPAPALQTPSPHQDRAPPAAS